MSPTIAVVAVVVAICNAAARAEDAYFGTDEPGNIHINSTTGAAYKVFIDGVDILAEIRWLQQTTAQLQSQASAPPTPTPTTPTPTSLAPTTSVPTTSAPTTVAPSASPTFLVTCGSATISSDADLAQQLPSLRRCGTFTGAVTIVGGAAWPGGGIANHTLLSEAFENVRHVNGGFSIRYTGLRTLGAAFTNLRTTGEYHVYGNALLASLGTAFGTLRAVGHSLYIQHNAVLTGPGGVAFSDLESIGGGSGRLNFYLNGIPGSWRTSGTTRTAGSQAFCASFAPRLCPATSFYHHQGWPDDARQCCPAFCSNSAAC